MASIAKRGRSQSRIAGAFCLAALMLLVSTHKTPTLAAELVMFHQEACEWCEVWDEEVGVVYDKTTEAKTAPLRRVDIHEDRPSDLAGIKPVVFTPTFVLTENGSEIGRIIGYPGEDFFWGLLGQLLARVTPATCNKEAADCQH